MVVVLAGEARAAFERPPLSPSSAALGGIVALSVDPVFGNPAGPPGASGLRMELWGARPFGLPGLVEAQAAIATSFRAGSAGIGVRRFGAETYGEDEIRAFLSVHPGSGISAGLAVRGLEVGGTGLAPHRSVALDAGFRVRPSPASEIAAVVGTVAGEVPGDPGGEARRTAVGLARTFGTLTVVLEGQHESSRPLAGVLGVELRLHPSFVVRAGAREDPLELSWGFSLHPGSLEIAASVSHHESLDETVRIGVRRVPRSAKESLKPLSGSPIHN